jgi:hypothetical protein
MQKSVRRSCVAANRRMKFCNLTAFGGFKRAGLPREQKNIPVSYFLATY